VDAGRRLKRGGAGRTEPARRVSPYSPGDARPPRQSLIALALYTATSTVVFGWSLWPHPGRGIIGLGNQKDPEIFISSFAWWPHAIGSWTNPFITSRS
jgi:hypothetical protein